MKFRLFFYLILMQHLIVGVEVCASAADLPFSSVYSEDQFEFLMKHYIIQLKKGKNKAIRNLDDHCVDRLAIAHALIDKHHLPACEDIFVSHVEHHKIDQLVSMRFVDQTRLFHFYVALLVKVAVDENLIEDRVVDFNTAKNHFLPLNKWKGLMIPFPFGELLFTVNASKSHYFDIQQGVLPNQDDLWRVFEIY